MIIYELIFVPKVYLLKFCEKLLCDNWRFTFPILLKLCMSTHIGNGFHVLYTLLLDFPLTSSVVTNYVTFDDKKVFSPLCVFVLRK